jgi:hypothetical protein
MIEREFKNRIPRDTSTPEKAAAWEAIERTAAPPPARRARAMSETRKFRDLVRETMSPESQERAARRTQDLLDALPAAPAERGAESEVPDLAGVLREIADLYVGKDRPHAYGFMLEAAARLASRAAAPGEGAEDAND